MSKHTIILTEDQVKAILEKRKKAVRNAEGDIVPEQCDECGAKVGLYIQGEPVYLCSKCHKYFGTMPFHLHEGKTCVSNILNEGYWGHLPLENDSVLDEFGDIAYNNIGERFKEYMKEKIADEKKRSEKAERIRQMNAQAKLGEPSEGKDLAVPITEAVTGEDDKKAAAIYAYCESEDGNDYCILCAKRIEGDEKGKYNPPMGHLHVGEAPKDGAVRECEEESGVKIPKDKLRLGSTEKWGTNYYVYLEGTPKDWPIGDGDEENEQFMWIPMKDLFFGDKKDWEWAWSTKEFANRFAPAELDLSERHERKNVILSEEQVHSIQRKIFTESFSPKRQVVLLIKDYLDKSFAKTFVDDINDNGYPVKVPMVSMLSANGQTLKQMQIQDLLILLDDKFRNLIKKDDDRKALLKQIIIDWFNGNISKEGLLSKNSL